MLTTISNVRYLNKSNNANERENYAKWWKEQIEHYGTVVDYYTHGYNLTSHNFLYGEDPTSKYLKTEGVIMLTDITNDALMLSKFGIMADCDMTAVIHISSYYEKFGCGKEPKAGDLIQLTEYAADRPGGRSAPIYEITERDDEYLQMTNALMSHYVWYIKCKRFEYSYEPGITPGVNERQISDGGDYGHFGEEEQGEMFQPYPDSVQNSAKSIYDYYSEDESDLNLRANHYVAPDLPSCPVEGFLVTSLSAVPGPYSKLSETTIEYTQDLQDLVFNAARGAKVVRENKNNILMDVTTPSDDPDLHKFSTLGKPEDTIEYTAPDGTIDITSVSGGTNL